MVLISHLKKIFTKTKSFSKPFKEYHFVRANHVNNIAPIKGKTVLIVGCSTGIDCKIFIDMGAESIFGIDVNDNIGKDFSHPRVRYVKCSVENMEQLETGTFSLVYSLATLEHVPNIEPAFKEMVRVTQPGGFIYTFAAPLWNSPWGHHKGLFFENYPWIHLRKSEMEIIEFCHKNGITDPDNRHQIDLHVKYMLDSRHFNKVESSKYVEVCQNLSGVKILRNSLGYATESILTDEIREELASKGYSKDELLAKNHLFVGQKL